MLTDGTWYNDPTLLTSLSHFQPSLFSHPLVRSLVPLSLSLSFPPLSVSRILFVRLPTARATLGRNPNSVAKRLRRIDPTPICISFVLEREIFCVPCFIKSKREKERERAPRPLSVFRDDLPFRLWKALL